MQTPKIGDDVLYRQPDEGAGVNLSPAIVVKVLKTNGSQKGAVILFVMSERGASTIGPVYYGSNVGQWLRDGEFGVTA